jgi:tetratricopeptide (TPR) repeat protein
MTQTDETIQDEHDLDAPPEHDEASEASEDEAIAPDEDAPQDEEASDEAAGEDAPEEDAPEPEVEDEPAEEVAQAEEEGDEEAEASEPEAPEEPEYEEVDEEALVDFAELRDKIQALVDSGEGAHAAMALEQFSRWPDSTRHLTDNVWLYRTLGDLVREEDVAGALEHYRHAYALEPRALDVLLPYSDLLLANGEHAEGLRVLQAMVLHHKRSMETGERITLYHRIGACHEAMGRLDLARAAYEKALEQNVGHSSSLAGLLRVVTEVGEPHEIVKVRQRLIRSLDDDGARSMALVALGDDWAERFNDPGRALDTYEQALAEFPENRRALERMAEVGAQQEDWRRVARSFFTLSRLCNDPAEEAAWLVRASDIAREQLWESKKALAGYTRALELDPTRLDAFRVITSILVDSSDWEGLRDAYTNLINAIAQRPDPDGKLLAVLCQKLGELCRTHLNEPEVALDAFVNAAALVPDSVELHEHVVEIAEKDADEPEKYAIALEHLGHLRRLQPGNLDLLDRVGRAHLRAKQFDRAYCVYRALVALGHDVSPKAADFVRRFTKPTFRGPKAEISTKLMRDEIFVDGMNAGISEVFTILKPALEEWTSEAPKRYGLKRRDRIKITEKLAFNNIYQSVGARLGYDALPEIWRKPEQIGLINGALTPEGLIVGDEMFGSGNEREIAFVVAKQLFLFLAPFYIAAIRPLEQLQGFFMLGMAHAKPNQFKPPGDSTSQQIMKTIGKRVRGADAQRLERAVEYLLKQGGEIDLATWREAVESSANRVGFLFCDDFGAVASYLGREPQRLSVRSSADRVRELVEWSLTPEYAALRERLGLSVG